MASIPRTSTSLRSPSPYEVAQPRASASAAPPAGPPYRSARLRAGGRAIALALVCAVTAGCYHYHVVAPEPDPATEPQRRTVHAIAWGLVGKPDVTRAANCAPSNALDRVRVTNNLGYTLITVLSLGFWAPVQVEWRCAKAPGDGGVIQEERR